MSNKAKDNQKLPQNQSYPIRKSILRNPEVPITSTDYIKSINDLPRQQTTWHSELSNNSRSTNQQQQPNSRAYHEPRLNKISEMRKTLNEVKSYEAKTLESVHDLTKNSQKLVNREVRLLDKYKAQRINIIFLDLIKA